jgi:exosortase
MTKESLSIKIDFSKRSLVAWVLPGVALVWTYWPTFRGLAHKWATDPGYSHGVLVPFFAGYLLWSRRELWQVGPPAWGWGLALLTLGVVIRLLGGTFIFFWFDAVSLLPILAALVLLSAGKSATKAVWPAIAFLFFMIPLPYKLETALGSPLQTLASRGSTFLLQVLGQPAVREGNTIMIHDIKLGVVEACSGLRMLVTFFTFSTAVALLIRKPVLERCCVVASAVPIALLTNMLRITATGVMYQIDATFAQRFFHDWAGWFMMPVCLAMLGIELWVLDRLIIENPVMGPRRNWALT